MPRVLGYLQPLSVRAGERLGVRLSSEEPSSVTPRVVRLRGPQAGQGSVEASHDAQEWGAPSEVRVGPQVLRRGSHLTAALDGLNLPALAIATWVLPTVITDATQVVASVSGERGSVELGVTAGVLNLSWRGRGTPDASRAAQVSLPVEDLAGRWWYVVAAVDSTASRISLHVGFESPSGKPQWRHAEREGVEVLVGGLQSISAASRPGLGSAAHFTGRIDGLALLSRAPGSADLALLDVGSGKGYGANDRGVAFYFDFAQGPESTTVVERVRGCHGVLFNRPTRAVRGPSWTPGHLDFRVAPHMWSAVHFHADDLDDARWDVTFEVDVPVSAESGIYAVALGEADEVLPFFVLPAQPSTAKVVFLAPTNTYLAYGNEHLGEGERGLAHEKMMSAPISLSPTERFVHAHPELGRSLYDTHLDGSGVSTASWRRPIPNFAPNGPTWLTAGPRHFAADLFITGWLEHLDVGFDVLTDADLHVGGVEALEGYEVLITGSHPEYPTTAEIDTLAAFVRGGGNVMYLGGNGFYWATACAPDTTDVIECRRGSAAQRNWTSPPGEGHLAFTGEPGGAHHHLGRSPRELFGVLSVGAGWGPAVGYVRGDHASDPSVSWVFDGLSDAEVIGDYGYMLGGAAGDEVDSADFRQGTPARTRLLLRSLPLGDQYYPFLDSVLAVEPGQVASVNPDVRSDVVLVPGEDGAGSVFSVGSICWAGALAWDGYVNDIATLTTNVLRRLAPTALTASG